MCKLHVWIPLSLSVGQLEVVLHDELTKDHLDLVGGKEATGACVATVAKVQAVGADADKLVEGTALVGRLLCVLAHLVEAQRVELFGIVEHLRIGADGDGGDFNRYAGGHHTAIGERKSSQDLALERCYGQ